MLKNYEKFLQQRNNYVDLANQYIFWKRKIQIAFTLPNAKILANGCNGLQNCRRKQNEKNYNVA